jgi:hypothetical protein
MVLRLWERSALFVCGLGPVAPNTRYYAGA